MAGETVVYRTRLHWVLFAGPAIATGFFVVLALVTLLNRDRPAAPLWLFFALLTGLMLAIRYALYRTSEFAVTNKRVLIKTGLLRRHSVEILLSKVEAIGVDQPLLGRLLGYGSLTVGGTEAPRLSDLSLSRIHRSWSRSSR